MELKMKVEEKEVQINELHGVIDTHVKTITHLEVDIKDAKYANDKVSKDLEQTLFKQERMQIEYNNILFEVNKARKNLQEKVQENKVCTPKLSTLNLFDITYDRSYSKSIYLSSKTSFL